MMEVADIQTAETPAPFKPALGRIVHVYSAGEAQPEVGIITRVHNDICINVTVFPNGISNTTICFSSVTNNPNDFTYWQSPPRV